MVTTMSISPKASRTNKWIDFRCTLSNRFSWNQRGIKFNYACSEPEEGTRKPPLYCPAGNHPCSVLQETIPVRSYRKPPLYCPTGNHPCTVLQEPIPVRSYRKPPLYCPTGNHPCTVLQETIPVRFYRKPPLYCATGNHPCTVLSYRKPPLYCSTGNHPCTVLQETTPVRSYATMTISCHDKSVSRGVPHLLWLISVLVRYVSMCVTLFGLLNVSPRCKGSYIVTIPWSWVWEGNVPLTVEIVCSGMPQQPRNPILGS